MDIRKLQKIVVSALEDIKGKDIEVINTTKLTSMFDRLVIATGDSNRQVKSLARNVQDKVREAGAEVLSVEGEETGAPGARAGRRRWMFRGGARAKTPRSVA